MPLVLVLAAASAVVGCASNLPGVVVDDLGTTGSLAGRTFLSESVTEDGQPRPLVDGTRIELSFSEDGRVTASAGCNFASAPVEVVRGRILVGDLATTEMACARELHDQDEWLAGVLAADPAHVLRGSRLRLEADGVVIGLVDREVAQPDRPLERTVWELDSIVDGDTVSSLPAGTGATLVFGDGRVVIRVENCNQGSGDVEIGGSEIEVGVLRMTLRACEQHPSEVEAAVTMVLNGRIGYQIDADMLTLAHPNGRALVLRGSEPTSPSE
jgi:heat shock protein HslJ